MRTNSESASAGYDRDRLATERRLIRLHCRDETVIDRLLFGRWNSMKSGASRNFVELHLDAPPARIQSQHFGLLENVDDEGISLVVGLTALALREPVDAGLNAFDRPETDIDHARARKLTISVMVVDR